MKTKEEIRQHLSKYTAKLKPNSNHFIIINKWNSKVIEPYKYEIFDYLSECIDEAIIESLKTYPSYFPMITEINKGVKFQMSDIDNDEHLWYNKFNKWSWNKFENGVIKIEDDERRI